LSGSVIHFIRASHIKGELFPNMSVTDIDNMIKRVMPDKTATPHYWRSYYTVNVLSKMPNKEDITEALRIMDHSLAVNASYYNKQASTAYNSLLAGK
jgi:tagatose-1,6-bisphosphate aldolase non-catalytic subunit AgaZ/GatZ